MAPQRAHPHESREEHFWCSVSSTDDDACWEWRGFRNPGGYGKCYGVVADEQLAHRVAWIITNGPVPDGLFVLHHCDNRPCCNPHHLFVGTQQQNMADMQAKGRRNHLVGEMSAHHKLTEEQVREIRSSNEHKLSLAERFGISHRHVYKICRGECYVITEEKVR